jgi:hypothetical protein
MICTHLHIRSVLLYLNGGRLPHLPQVRENLDVWSLKKKKKKKYALDLYARVVLPADSGW